MPGPPAAVSQPVGLIGAGRAGVGLALALARAGCAVRLSGRRPISVPEPLRLTVTSGAAPPPWLAEARVVILAVRDDAITSLADGLAASGAVTADHVVLHLSGGWGREVLESLAPSGAALGSLHPLQTIAEPERAPGRLRGSWAAVEGTDRAVQVAEQLARRVGMRPFRLAASAKVVYHAGAVFAANYLVVVEAVAQRLLTLAGLRGEEAWQALRPLVEGTLENLSASGPPGALTGPVTRGDARTVRRHLAALSPDDAELYRLLGRAALELARRGGMDESSATRMAQALATGPPPSRRAGEQS